MLDWLQENEAVLWTLAAASLLAFLGTLVVVPALIVRIPHDYFAHRERPPGRWSRSHPALRIAALVAKNALGAFLIAAGLVLLVLPGQGLLTMLLGFLLLDFPGKYALEKRLVARPRVRTALDWLRRRARRAPIETEQA